MSAEDRLRGLTDSELAALVAELEERAELFDAQTKAAVNDELRRRRWPLLGMGRRRWAR